MKYWRNTFLAIGLIPMLFSLFLIAFYIHARIALGYFPRYDMPDPKALAFYYCYAPVIYITLIPTYLILDPLWIVLILIFVLSRLRKEKYDKFILFSSIGIVLSCILYVCGIIEWFVD